MSPALVRFRYLTCSTPQSPARFRDGHSEKRHRIERKKKKNQEKWSYIYLISDTIETCFKSPKTPVSCIIVVVDNNFRKHRFFPWGCYCCCGVYTRPEQGIFSPWIFFSRFAPYQKKKKKKLSPALLKRHATVHRRLQCTIFECRPTAMNKFNFQYKKFIINYQYHVTLYNYNKLWIIAVCVSPLGNSVQFKWLAQNKKRIHPFFDF